MRNHYRMLSTDELVEAGLYGPDNTSLTIVLAERLQDGYDTMDLDAENEALELEIANLQNALEAARDEIISLEYEIIALQEELGIVEDDAQ